MSAIVEKVVTYLLKLIDKETDGALSKAVTVVVSFVASLGLVVTGIVLVKDPQLFYRGMHWGFVLGFGIVFTIAMFVFAFVSGNYNEKMGFTQLLFAAIFLILLICGLCFPNRTVYVIKDAYDFNLLNNLPPSKEVAYQFELAHDIDFSGVEPQNVYGTLFRTNYVLDGKGHSIKNLKYVRELTGDNATFISVGSGDTIKNLTLENSTFHLTPNNYQNYSGAECGFKIISGHTENVHINVDVIVYPTSIQDSRNEGISTLPVENILPATTVEPNENGCTYQINVTYNG